MKPKKRQMQLIKRQQAWAKLKSELKEKASSRYDAGGYRQPGSLKQY